MHKPCMMDEKNWSMIIRFDWWSINLIEEWGEFWHYLWDITESCVREVVNYWIWKCEELWKDKVQFSHPCSDWLIEVRKKKEPRYKKLFYLFE